MKSLQSDKKKPTATLSYSSLPNIFWETNSNVLIDWHQNNFPSINIR